MEKFENLAELSPSGHSIQFYKEKTLEKLFICETCNEPILESDHLMVSGGHYHKHHLRCSECNVNLNSDCQTNFIIRLIVTLLLLFFHTSSFYLVVTSSFVRPITEQISLFASIAMTLSKRTLSRLWGKVTTRNISSAQFAF